MSFKSVTSCRSLQMPPVAKAVLMTLADAENFKTGQCNPTIPTIAKYTCYSQRAVQEAIYWLERSGAIKATRKLGFSTHYLITPEDFRPTHQTRPYPRTTCVPTHAPDASVTADGSTLRLHDTYAQHASPARTTCVPPTHDVRPNQKETEVTGRTTRKRSSADLPNGRFSAWPTKPSEELLAEWLLVRKQKRCTNTQTAFDAIGKQITLAVEKLGLTVDTVLKIAVARSWGGIEAEWLPQWKSQFLSCVSSRSPTVNGKLSVTENFEGKNYEGTPDQDIPAHLRPQLELEPAGADVP